MPQHALALAGREAVRTGQEKVFAAIKLAVRFEIHEIEESGEWTWARTSSSGLLGTPALPSHESPLPWIADGIGAGGMPSLRSSTLEFDDVRRAHGLIENNRALGKLLFACNPIWRRIMPMRNPLQLLPVALAALLPLSAAATEPVSADSDQAAITRQLDRYEQALNSADIDTVMKLYAKDAVFMPQHGLPAEGRDAILTAYRHVFDTIRLNIDFSIDEIGVLSPDWAYARTRSNGTVKVLASDQPPAPEANQELFLLHRETDGQWRFARYIFSTTNPPRQR